jgi:hypothetical protein
LTREHGIQSRLGRIQYVLDAGWSLSASVCGGFISLLPAFGWLAGQHDGLDDIFGNCDTVSVLE